MKTLLHTSLEKALNAYLKNDTQSAARLTKMAGKTISIELLPMHLHFNCHFTAEHVLISTHAEDAPLTKIKGTPLQMLGALMAKESRHQFFADDLKIEGDAEFAQQVINLFDNVNIDWEEHLARLIGDVPAFKLSNLAGDFKNWLGKARDGFTADVNDYLHEEAAWFPHKEELDIFFTDIDNLRMDADRLEFRLARIKTMLENEDIK